MLSVDTSMEVVTSAEEVGKEEEGARVLVEAVEDGIEVEESVK